MGIKMYKTTYHSDLYWKVHKVYHVGDTHVKLKMSVYYKSNDSVCEWIGAYKNCKIIKNVFDHWIDYKPSKGNNE